MSTPLAMCSFSSYGEPCVRRHPQMLERRNAQITPRFAAIRNTDSGLQYIHARGVCVRDISPENLLIKRIPRSTSMTTPGIASDAAAADDDNDDSSLVLCITDLGMAFRIPCHDDGIPAKVRPQGQAGKYLFMAPEIFSNDEPFDAAQIDLWACGVVGREHIGHSIHITLYTLAALAVRPLNSRQSGA